MKPPKVCPGTEELGAYLEGREPRDSVELHLAACASCRAEVKDYARLLKEVGETDAAAPPGLSARILRTAVRPSRRPALAVALIAAALLVAAGLVLLGRPAPPVEPQAAVPAPRPVPPPAPEKETELPVAPPKPPAPPPVPEKRPAPAPAPEAPKTKIPETIVLPPEPPPPKPPAPAPEPPKPVVPTRTAVARVQSFTGRVAVLSAKGPVPCGPDADILPESGLQTFPGSAAVVVFPDGTALEIDASTTLRRLLDLEGQGKRVELESGAIAARVAKQPAGRAMVFATPHGEAQVLGTAFRLAVIGARGDATRLEVTEGKVRLKRLDGKSVDVPAGQFALAETGTDLVARKATSLVLHWKLDDAQGALARDASGNGNDGVVAGEPGWAAGHAGGALDLLRARVDSPLLDLGKDVRSFTAAFWVSQETMPGYQDNYFQLIPGLAMVREANMGTGRIRVTLKTDETGPTWGFDSVIMKARQWTHVALAWDGAVAVLYRNGRDVAKVKVSGRLAAPQGFIARLGGSEKLDAKIDDVRLYRRALTEAEIAAVMAGGSVR